MTERYGAASRITTKDYMTSNPPTIARLPAVLNYLGIGKTSLYKLIADGKFRKPLKLGARAVGWLTSDVTEFLEARAAARQAAA